MNWPAIRDISEQYKWRYAIGSPHFIVVVEAAAPMKGVYDIAPRFCITSGLDPTRLEYMDTLELNADLSKALDFASCMVKAAKYDEKYISLGRTVWIRNITGIFQIVGVSDPKEKILVVRRFISDSTECQSVSMWDTIPIVEEIDA